jgi:type IV pilus assembly protein PilF
MSGDLPGLAVVLMVMAAGLSACVTDGASVSMAPEPQRAVSELPTTNNEQRSAKIHVELGTAYMQSGRNGVALDEARAAIASDAGYAPAHLLMALVYADQEQFAYAGPAFEQAYRLAPGDPEVNNAYGWYLCSQGREAEGLPRIEQAARNPYYATPAKAWINAGLCLMRKKDDAGAQARFQRAIQADAGNARAAIYLAQINYRNGRELAAKQWIDQAQKYMRTSNASVLWLAARIERKLGNDVTVNELGSRLRKEFPASEEYQDYLQGKFE